MRNLIILLTISIFTLNAYSTATEDITDVNTIVNNANLSAYYQGDNGKANVKMTITDKNGLERTREFAIVRYDVNDGGNQKYFVYFKKPADVRKMVFMVHKQAAVDKEDDRWLYMPALDLVKRIAASDKRTSFVGSDFYYEDVSGRNLLEDIHELTSTDANNYVVKNTPKNPDAVEFSYYDVHIDKKTFMPVKMEYYDKGGKLYRIIESQEIKEIQDFPTVVRSQVKDLNSGSTTLMEFSDIQYNTDIKEDIFTERYLRRPPRELTR